MAMGSLVTMGRSRAWYLLLSYLRILDDQDDLSIMLKAWSERTTRLRWR